MTGPTSLIASFGATHHIFDAFKLEWVDNSVCSSRLTSINLKLWPDGVIPSKNGTDGDDYRNRVESLKSETFAEPITYNIPISCLKSYYRENNFLMTLGDIRRFYYPYRECSAVEWKPLDKCRKYVIEMESQYSSTWTGPTSLLTIFTFVKQGQ